jgi:hypothetical protein
MLFKEIVYGRITSKSTQLLSKTRLSQWDELISSALSPCEPIADSLQLSAKDSVSITTFG